MTNNDCLRQLRDIQDIDETAMITIFALAEQQVTPDQMEALLKEDEDPGFTACTDTQLAAFLNGFIIERRGKREGEQPAPETQLNNNIIFKKLRIAFDLKADDILSVLSLANCQLGKHELGAFFRKPDNRHFRVCSDEVLQDFLSGLKTIFREADISQDSITEPDKAS